MTDKRYTIKEVAEQLGVSKTAIRKYMDAEFREKYTTVAANGAIYIETEGVTLLRTKCNGSRKSTETFENQGVETSSNEIAPSLVAALVAQLEAKDKQIASLTTALENAYDALRTEQERHLLEAPKQRRLFGWLKRKDGQNAD